MKMFTSKALLIILFLFLSINLTQAEKENTLLYKPQDIITNQDNINNEKATDPSADSCIFNPVGTMKAEFSQYKQDASSSKAGITADYKTKNVIIVTMDGLRSCESMLDAEHEYIPNIWNHIAPLGCRNFSMETSTMTSSVPGHYTIATGVNEVFPTDATALDSFRPQVPTIFECYNKTFNKSKLSSFYISSFENLTLRTNCSISPYIGTAYGAASDCSDQFLSKFDDDYTLEKTIEIMDTYHPNLMLVNFFAIDEMGHKGNYTNWVNTIINTDQCVYALWQKIQSDPFYKDNTTFIITADHGRHDDEHMTGFTDHGLDLCDGCRKVQFFAVGPDFKKSAVFNISRNLIDIAPTVAELLGFEMPYAKGRVMWELFSKIKSTNLKKGNFPPCYNYPQISVLKQDEDYYPIVLSSVLPRKTTNGNDQVYFQKFDPFFTKEILNKPISQNSLYALYPDVCVSNGVIHTVHMGWIPTDGTYENSEDQQQVFYRRSSDQGATWSDKKQLNGFPAMRTRFWNDNPNISADGDFLFTVYAADAAYIGYNRSFDNGNTWTDFEYINHTIRPRKPQAALNDNYVHFVYYDLEDTLIPEAVIDIYYLRSTDYGATWSSSKLITHFSDSGKKDLKYDVNGLYFKEKMPINPSIAVSGAYVHITWMQYDKDNVWRVYYSRSQDNGETFSNPITLSLYTYNSIEPKIGCNGSKVIVSWIRHDKLSNDISPVYRVSSNNGSNFDATIKAPNSLTKGFAQNLDMTSIDNRAYFVWEEHSGEFPVYTISYLEY